ncbi:unnamed protein product [Darwinula stevensoni]|uniref:TGF-beta family profile domain-containing protein n=1 Tax=Darwinula stevensoni TaxID=69355 RepID=A0A7R8X4J8_9CRUS|nr:unnamed protein product [Darwinula stevensoni]CAG0883628.1 unnamed protein product [Darwinula stevensoni]
MYGLSILTRFFLVLLSLCPLRVGQDADNHLLRSNSFRQKTTTPPPTSHPPSTVTSPPPTVPPSPPPTPPPDPTRELLLEKIKLEILEKLRLQNAPNASVGSEELQQLLALMPVPASRTQHASSDPFYGKTEQVIVFSDHYTSTDEKADDETCRGDCFRFRLPEESRNWAITSALLYLHLEPHAFHQSALTRDNSLTLLVHQLRAGDGSPYRLKVAEKTLHLDPRSGGWVALDIQLMARHWVPVGIVTPLLEVTCPSCHVHAPGLNATGVISDKPGSRPSIIFSLDPSRQETARLRRSSVDCLPLSKECCREHLYVSFKEIHWDNWILEPQGYRAYHCKGSCASLLRKDNPHSIIRQELARLQTESWQALMPCCTPTKMRSLSLLYLIDDKIAKYENLPNMIVDACGCL